MFFNTALSSITASPERSLSQSEVLISAGTISLNGARETRSRRERNVVGDARKATIAVLGAGCFARLIDIVDKGSYSKLFFFQGETK